MRVNRSVVSVLISVTCAASMSILTTAPAIAKPSDVGNMADCKAAKTALAKAKKSGNEQRVKAAQRAVRKACPIASGTLPWNVTTNGQ